MNTEKETEKCVKLLEANGYKIRTNTDGVFCYTPVSAKCSDVEICPDEIVFVGDNGDWLHIPVNYYALIGALIHFSQLGIGYKH